MNSKVAYVFPGQGSQKAGMGLDLYENNREAKEIFEAADRVLGFQLSDLMFNGPEDELKLTVNAQPALVTTSIAAYKAASVDRKIESPGFLAGHSLGEYTALNIAGVLTFEDTVYLSRERGRLMYEAGQKLSGSMAAIIGMKEEEVEAVCNDSNTVIANYNSPGQIVISGNKESIDHAVALAKDRGAARAIPLAVSGAFHSPLMEPAIEGLRQAISSIEFKEPEIPIIANTTAKPLISAADIKDELLKQLNQSVRWQQSVQFMIDSGVSTFIEIGTGNVLSGLIKRINKQVKVLNVGTINDLDNIEAV
jgi:[acyl-carrier-protein] S-malonyltransferase